MNWTSYDTWIILTAALCAAACALPGTFLVLRRLSMMGDAISHAVLPGIAIAFLLTGARDSLPMFIGACATGVLAAFLVEFLARSNRMDEGSAMGVAFTSLFALGILLITRGARQVDLDPACVLYGAIEITPLDTISIGAMEVPRAFLRNGLLLLVNLFIVVLLYKELALATFDPTQARLGGFRPRFLHYLLITMTAATCVVAFESVGSILVVAMLVGPAAIALLLTRSLHMVLILAVMIGVLCAITGHIGAIIFPAVLGLPSTSTSGMISVMVGVVLVLVIVAKRLFAPRSVLTEGNVVGGRSLGENLQR